jgi:1-acyl-sn-glycerol-3-phosphate acyltransferase
MIDAHPRALGGRFIRALLFRSLRRGLSALRVDGAERLDPSRPLLLCPNHVSFHDGLIVALLSRHFPDARVLMRADQLRRAPLLRWAGATGVEEDALDGARALRFGARFLDRPGRALWLFPQGRLRPQWARPLGFREGAGFIARRSGATLLPVSIHYEPGEREQPEAWVRIGAPTDPAGLERAVEQGLDEIRARILAGTAPARP